MDRKLVYFGPRYCGRRFLNPAAASEALIDRVVPILSRGVALTERCVSFSTVVWHR